MKLLSGCSKITPISEVMAERVLKWAKPEFDVSVLSYPLGLCSACWLNLSKCERLGAPNHGAKATWDDFNLQQIYIPRGQEAQSCCCDICVARRMNHTGSKGFNGTVIKKEKIKNLPKGEHILKKAEGKKNERNGMY